MTEVPGEGEFEDLFPNHNPAKVIGLPSAYDNDHVNTYKRRT